MRWPWTKPPWDAEGNHICYQKSGKGAHGSNLPAFRGSAEHALRIKDMRRALGKCTRCGAPMKRPDLVTWTRTWRWLDHYVLEETLTPSDGGESHVSTHYLPDARFP
jgi:hypothetical protein